MRENGHQRIGDQQSQSRAAGAQQQALGQQGATQCTGAGAQRRANAQFAFPADGASQKQVGDIRTSDNEDQHRRRHENQQYGPRIRS